MSKLGSAWVLLFFVLSFSVAQAQLPNCQSTDGSILPVDDAQVLKLKISTPNQFLTRAHVKGLIANVFPDHSGHKHIEVKIGNGPNDTIEVVYNESFGALPALASGMSIEACGDYITANAATSQYPASADGAILHWVHRSTGAHLGGFVAIDNSVFGQGQGNGGN